MRAIYLTFLLLLAIASTNCSKQDTHNAVPEASVHIIPKPASIDLGDGQFVLSSSTSIMYVTEMEPVASYLSELLNLYLDDVPDIEIIESGDTGSEGNITLSMDNSIPHPEGYVMDIRAEQIDISASTPKGAFYAIQSLRQIIPSEALGKSVSNVSLPVVKIEDQPRYTYRGMHLDVGRHFFSVDFIKKYIDLLALHKLNTFHWHLTEDQGWRIEIDKYPLLTEVGAYRAQTLVGHYRDQPHQFDGKRYGGYYSKEEVREVVEYAQSRFVTVIPEIEMPGHALAALAAYPELACTDGPFQVAQKWGIFEEVFCPTEETFTFLENVLLEVMELFPGKYIHIGGDEAPKVRWEESPEAQAVMRREGLKDEHELQSYFIQRIEKFVNSHGKQIIGWDEILEGGLAPNATVMSWRGTEGGIAAARQGHDVIMSPTSHLYFDYYQAEPSQEPLAIGGNLPLSKVYHFEPTPDELSEEEAKHILGAQANLWTEYIPTPEKVEYMIFPRACALAELNWTSDEHKDYEDFILRLSYHFDLLDALDVNYAKTLYNITAEMLPDTQQQVLNIKLSSEFPGLTIRYTVDGSTPTTSSTIYQDVISPSNSITLKAAAFQQGTQVGNVFQQEINLHKAIAIKPKLEHQPAEKYNAGPYVLTNSIRGTEIFNDLWYGFDGDDLSAEVDLGEIQTLSKIQIGVLHTPYAWIFYPSQVIIAVSEDGNDYEAVYEEEDITAIEEETPVGMKNHTATLNDVHARFIRISAKNTIIPSWHGGSGNGSWLFVDEIIVE